MLPLPDDYVANYDQIAGDHLTQYRKDGGNPWVLPHEIQLMNDATAALIDKHAEPGDRILDVGVGLGQLLSRFPNLDRYGVDIAHAYLEIAAGNGITCSHAAAEALPYPDDWFSIVVCTDVLEHVLWLRPVVDEIVRVARPEGIIVVRCPNDEAYLDPGVYAFCHLRRLNAKALADVFRAAGATLIDQSLVGGLRTEEINVVFWKEPDAAVAGWRTHPDA